MALKEIYRNAESNTAAIAATTSWNIRPATDIRDRYGPFNVLFVQNNASDETIQVRLNGKSDDYLPVKPAGGTLVIGLNDGITFYYLDIYNEDATQIEIGEVVVRYARIADVQGVV